MKIEQARVILGIDESATSDEIKLRWRKLCMVHHPDRGGNLCDFNEIREAYKIAHAEALLPKKCRACDGKGKVTRGRGFAYVEVACPTCSGSGEES